MTRSTHEVMVALRAAAQAQRATAAALEALAELVTSADEGAAPSRELHRPELLTVAQAAKQIGMSASYVYRAIEEGRLPVARLGNRVRVRPDELARFVERRTLPDALAPVVPLKGQAPNVEEVPRDNRERHRKPPAGPALAGAVPGSFVSSDSTPGPGALSRARGEE